jgi:hypothetical protein
VGKALVQKREQSTAPEWHGKIWRTRSGGRRPIAARLKEKMIRTFLIGVLSGVIMAAAVTLAFTIPANSDYWRMEIWKRGGGAWLFDKNGHLSWAWTVEPIPDTPSKKRVIVPSSDVNVRSEQL